MYKPSPDVLARIENDFSYHPPHGDQVRRYAAIRETCKTAALQLAELCPPSRELSVALTGLSEVCMNANAAIARNEKAPEGLEGTVYWMEPIPDYGDLMSVDKYFDLADDILTSYDGSGNLATATEMSNLSVHNYSRDKVPPMFTHVIWFNK